MQSFLKTTGGKGLHVVAPIRPENEWPIIKEFAHNLVLGIKRKNPRLYVTKMTKAIRKDRIYLDYLRNDRGSTAIAPYSTRARSGAPVALPLDWKELNAKSRPTFHVTDFSSWKKRLSRDPWAEMNELKLAPLSWCPHPENMISMHVAGDSMHPVIPSGSILFVDTGSTDRDQVNERLVVASHRDLGFKVARLQRLAGSDLLVSANPKYLPLDVSNATKWKIFGEVLWWVTKDVKLES